MPPSVVIKMHDADLRRSAFGKTRNDSVSVVIIEWTESKTKRI